MEEICIKPKSVFRNKNFNLVFLGALVSNIAALFYSFAVSFYILKITDNNALIQGLYLATGGVVFCVVTLFGGVISDRFNKARIMYICDYLKGIIILGFTLLLVFVIKSAEAQVAGLFIVNIFANAIAGIFSPASQALLPQIVEEASYQQAQSYFSILNSFQSIIGVILAGILYSVLPIWLLFLIVGICYILSAISEMFIKYKSEFENKDKLSIKIVFADLKEGFKYIASIKAVLALMICVLFVNFFFSPVFENFFPYFIATDITNSNYMFKEYMAPEMWNSFFSVAFGVGSLVMGIIFSTFKQREKSNRLIRYSLVFISLLLICISVLYYLFRKEIIDINSLLISTLILITIMGMVLVLINVPSSTVMMKLVQKDKFGKVSSVLSIGSQGLIPLSMFLGGVLITYIDSFGLLFVCAGGTLLIALILFFNRSIRKL